MLTFVLIFATVVAVYCFWIRPILKSRPELRELYQQEESFLVAFREKLKGIKQKLSSVLVIAASAAVVAASRLIEPSIPLSPVQRSYEPRLPGDVLFPRYCPEKIGANGGESVVQKRRNC